MIKDIERILGDEAESLLTHKCRTVPKEMLHLPGPDFIDRVLVGTDRRPQVLRNLAGV
ncbi:MAG TPA: fructose-bisphosphate aldolase, partial [Blastocatellia bacterium]|nr:fructose-bisphosphate aldolase [Blastocatellia bacterium]